MAFSDEYDFRKIGKGSSSKPRAQDFLQNKMYKQMSEQGSFEPTQTSSTPRVPQSERNDDGMIDAQIYNRFNEQNYNSSQQKMDPVQRGRQASAAADETVNAKGSFEGLRQQVIDQSDYYDAQSTQRQASIFGDMWNVDNAPDWYAPKDPKEIDTELTS
jgi:hypothetical protein